MVKRYQRALNGSMACVLLLLRKDLEVDGPEWVHVQEFLARRKLPPGVAASGDYAKLRFFGLLEKKAERREDGSDRNGFWRITRKGEQFADGLIQSPKFVYLYDNAPLPAPDAPLVWIDEVLGDKFSYAELMGRELPEH
jgi:hypothetical protein